MVELRRFLTYLPVVLLAAVALNQIRLAKSEHLVPWNGGGFGMFSTTDGDPNRYLHVMLLNEKFHKEVVIPEELQDLAKKVATLPTDRNLRGFANKVLDARSDQIINFTDIRVEVWRRTFDPIDLRPHAQKIKELVLKLDSRSS